MDKSEVFNIVVGLITIVSFIFAIVVWLKSNTKIGELIKVIKSIHEISNLAIWEFRISPAKGYEMRLRQAEETLGFMTSIREITTPYVTKSKSLGDENLKMLLDKRILWTTNTLDDFEATKELAEVWIVSQDLKPDSCDEETGKLVKKNLQKGIKYTYFCPDDLQNVQGERNRLLRNIGVTEKKAKDQVRILQIDRAKYDALFSSGNTVLYFHDVARRLLPKCFEEILLTQMHNRGIFWQEHSTSQADKIRSHLEAEFAKV
jgi:hypothetical protein